MKKKNWFKVLGSTFLSAMLLSACGSAEEGQTDTGNEEPNNEEATSYNVGIMQHVEHPSLDAASEGFQQALADAGLEVDFDFQTAQGDMSNNQTIANNFVGDNVDLIFANATPSAQAALSATQEIPVVFTSVTDPVGAGLVKAMDKPGPNVTGTTDTHPDAIPNTVNFLVEDLGAKKVGMIYNSGEQNSVAQVKVVKQAAEGTGLEIVERSVSTSAEVKQAAESLIGAVDSFYIITDNTVVSALESVIGVANENDLPLIVGELDSVARGGLAAYGFNYYDIGYEAGKMAVQILKGEKTPDQLPVQYPQNLKLQINTNAAEKMGIKIKDEWKEKAELIEGSAE